MYLVSGLPHADRVRAKLTAVRSNVFSVQHSDRDAQDGHGKRCIQCVTGGHLHGGDGGSQQVVVVV